MIGIVFVSLCAIFWIAMSLGSFNEKRYKW